MQSAAIIAKLSRLLLSAIVRYVRTAFRSRSAAVLRNLRGWHGQDWKAAPNWIAPARLRLQMRRLQPDHVGRAGAAGTSGPSPHSADTAVAARGKVDRIQKRDS